MRGSDLNILLDNLSVEELRKLGKRIEVEIQIRNSLSKTLRDTEKVGSNILVHYQAVVPSKKRKVKQHNFGLKSTNWDSRTIPNGIRIKSKKIDEIIEITEGVQDSLKTQFFSYNYIISKLNQKIHMIPTVDEIKKLINHYGYKKFLEVYNFITDKRVSIGVDINILSKGDNIYFEINSSTELNVLISNNERTKFMRLVLRKDRYEIIELSKECYYIIREIIKRS